MSPQSKRRSIYLQDEWWAELERLARDDKRSVNGVVRLAIGAFLVEQGAPMADTMRARRPRRPR